MSGELSQIELCNAIAQANTDGDRDTAWELRRELEDRFNPERLYCPSCGFLFPIEFRRKAEGRVPICRRCRTRKAGS